MSSSRGPTNNKKPSFPKQQFPGLVCHNSKTLCFFMVCFGPWSIGSIEFVPSFQEQADDATNRVRRRVLLRFVATTRRSQLEVIIAQTGPCRVVHIPDTTYGTAIYADQLGWWFGGSDCRSGQGWWWFGGSMGRHIWQSHGACLGRGGATKGCSTSLDMLSQYTQTRPMRLPYAAPEWPPWHHPN